MPQNGLQVIVAARRCSVHCHARGGGEFEIARGADGQGSLVVRVRIVSRVLREVAIVVGHMSVDVLKLDVGVVFREEGVELGSEIGEGWSIVGVLHPALLHQLVAMKVYNNE